MAQHDYVIANDTAANVRADINTALLAIASNNSGATAPATTYANQWWYDSTNDTLKIRSEANDAWISVAVLDQTNGRFSPVFAGPIEFADGSAAAPALTNTGDTNTGIFFPAADVVAVATDGSERVRVDASGNVGIGTNAPQAKLHALDTLKVSSADQSQGNVILGDGGSTGFNVGVGRWNGATNAAGAGGMGYFAQGAGNAGGHYFYTGDAAAGAQTERARLTTAGDFLVAKTAVGSGTVGVEARAIGLLSATRSGETVGLFNRLASDGTVIEIQQDTVTEGSISVSGTTVSYNGGHLSRWAQFPDNSRPELLKGTVMSNLDQMSNWDGEENEQLNCVDVSTVEGDPDVAGVFVAWDTLDDGYNDILLAMTGDMVIRIAKGVVVKRGDLLMSAGDGTAKPQDDDIIRSKTIAKVTSTHVSHEYEDGSYAVPCVPMAC